MAAANDTTAKRERKNFAPPRFAARKPGQRQLDKRAWRRIEEWRAYQATWTKPIDELECDKERFFGLRRYALNLNRKQVARILRVGVQSVLNWEHGTHPVPFYAFLALKLIADSLQYRFASEAWRDWKIGQVHESDASLKLRRDATFLSNAKTGAYFEPEHLDRLHSINQRNVFLEGKNRELQQLVDALTKENTQIRELFLADGVTADLHEVRDKLQVLFDRINTATVHKLAPKKAAEG